MSHSPVSATADETPFTDAPVAPVGGVDAPGSGQGGLDEVSSPVSWRKTLIRKFLPFAVSVALLGYVLGSIDWAEFGAMLSQVSVLPVIGVFLMAPFCAWLSAVKWQRLVRALGCDVRLSRLFEIYVVGQFYNNLLPTSAGGDVVRTVLLRRETKRGAEALSSIMAERFTGLVAMAVLAGGALIASVPVHDNRALTIATCAGLAFSLAVIAVGVWRRPVLWIDRRFGSIAGLAGPLAKVQKVQRALWSYREQPGELTTAIGLSFAFYAAAMFTAWLACVAFGQTVAVWHIVIAMPIAMVIMMLPLSLNGVGLLEWSFYETFRALGYPGELGLSVALMFRFRDILWSCGGYGVSTWLGHTQQLRRRASRD